MNRRMVMATRWTAAALAAALFIGCGASDRPRTATPPPAKPAAATEALHAQACAERLHDLCQWLLLHHAAQGQLPVTLAELTALNPDLTPDAWTCPDTHQPYRYDPLGWPAAQRGYRVILRDTVPSHLGHGMAILALNTAPGEALVLKVASLPATAPAFTQ